MCDIHSTVSATRQNDITVLDVAKSNDGVVDMLKSGLTDTDTHSKNNWARCLALCSQRRAECHSVATFAGKQDTPFAKAAGALNGAVDLSESRCKHDLCHLREFCWSCSDAASESVHRAA